MGVVARVTSWSHAQEVLQALQAPLSLLGDDQARVNREGGDDSLHGHVELRRSELAPVAFPYQLDLVEAMAARVASHEPGLLSLPTGAGKTRTAILAILRNLRVEPSLRCLWMAPSLELVEQATLSFVDLWKQTPGAPDVSLAVRAAVSEANIWFQTPQAMHRMRGSIEPFDVIVFDEAHQLGAPTFRKAVERWKHRDSSVIGLSATPGRVDESETRFLVEFFQGVLLTSATLGKDPVKSLQDQGVLASLSFKAIGSREQDLSDADRVRRLAKLCRHLANRSRRVMVFTATVAEAVGLSLYLRNVGVAADYVEGRLPEGERRARIAEFAAGKIRVIFNQRLLATGYDCPAVTDVVLGTRIGSPILFEQMVGRGARGPLTGGAKLARIWEFDDHLSIHGLPQSYYRYRDYDWG